LVKVIHDRDFASPTVPGNLTSPSKSETTVDLSWSASSDNVGVIQYEVYNGVNLVGTVTSTTYTVVGLTAATAYTFSIKAKDAAGNVSGVSNPLQVTTDPYLVKPKNTLAAVTVDGSLDEAVWSTVKPVAKTILGTPNHMAEYGALWDNDYLYVGVKVTDSELNNDSIEAYADDSVEIYIDGNHNKSTAYDSYDRQYIKGWNDSALFEKNGLTTDVQHAWGTISGGYTVELAIPWSALGITPTAGMTIGFDVAVNDDDNGDGRDSQLMWAGTNDNWTDTSMFGSLELSTVTIGDTQAPTVPTNLTSPTHTDRTATLSWTAATDNVGVVEYEIYNGAALAGTVTSTTYTVTGLTPSTAYTFTVKAKDAENNVSAASSAVNVTMDESYTLVHVNKAVTPVTVDGSLDEPVWAMVKSVDKAVNGKPNNSANFGVLWDNDYLYVGVKVTDDNLYNDSTEPYSDDSVEIYIDGNHNKGTTYDSYDRQYIKGWNDSALLESRGKTTGVKHAWAAIPGGYSVELAIPWSSLGITPIAGMTIGFDVASNDDDDGAGRDSQSMWAGTADNWTNTSMFGELQLSSASSTAPATVVMVNPQEPGGSNQWYVEPFSIAMNTASIPGVTIDTYYSFDAGTNWLTYSEPINMTQEGDYALSYRSVNSVGEVESTKTLSFMLDRTAPITAAASAPTGANGYSVTLAAVDSVSSVASTVYSLDGGATWLPYVQAIAFEQEGIWNIQYRSTDKAGNIEAVQTVTVRIDKTAPADAALAADITEPTNSNVTVTISYPADAAVKEYKVGASGTWTMYTAAVVLATNDTVYARGTDDAGNLSNVTSIVVSNIDKIAPVTVASVSPTAPNGSNGWYTSDVTVSLAVYDNLSGVANTEYQVNNGDWITYTGSIPAFGEGNYTIGYRSTDQAGNVELTQTIAFKIDKTAPLLTVQLDKTSIWPADHQMDTIHAALNSSDAASGVASVVLTSITSNEPDSGQGDIQANIGTAATSFSLRADRLGSGTGRTYTITYTATDKAGNNTVTSVTVTVPHDQSGN
jgi:chitodextrinase